MMRPQDMSFVVQGAIDHTISPITGKPMTMSCIESLRRFHPGCEVVLSTWPDQKIEGLDHDVLVLSEDPGAWNAFHPDADEVKLDNGNRQIVSTRNGLLRARRPYAAKIRTDMVFTGNSWMKAWGKYPKRMAEWQIFEERVITCSMFARDPECPYTRQALHPSDWVYIGLKHDLLKLWDIPLQTEPESSQWFLNRGVVPVPPPHDDDIRRFSPEQYVWRTFLAKFGPVKLDCRGHVCEENIRLTYLTFANNLIILDTDQFPFTVDRYQIPPWNWYRRYRFVSNREWEHLYHKYCDRVTARAHVRRMMNPHYHLKKAYFAWYRPWQSVRKLRGLPHAAGDPVGPQTV